MHTDNRGLYVVTFIFQGIWWYLREKTDVPTLSSAFKQGISP